MAGRHPRVPACSPKKCIIIHSYHSVLLKFCVHVKSTVEFFYAQATFTHARQPEHYLTEMHLRINMLNQTLNICQHSCFSHVLRPSCSAVSPWICKTLTVYRWEVVTHFCFIDDLATFSPFTPISTTTWQLTEWFKRCVRSLSLLKQTSYMLTFLLLLPQNSIDRSDAIGNQTL